MASPIPSVDVDQGCAGVEISSYGDESIAEGDRELHSLKQVPAYARHRLHARRPLFCTTSELPHQCEPTARPSGKPATTDYGTGVQGMSDRMAAVGGSVQLQSAPGEGTTVEGNVSASRTRALA